MPPIRVLYCIDNLDAGGTENQLVALINGMDRNKVIPHLVTLKPSKKNLGDLDCPVTELDLGSFRTLAPYRTIRQLNKLINSHSIDIVQTFFQDASTIGYLASLRSCARHRVASLRDLGFWRTWLNGVQMKFVYRRYDHFIANCSAVADHFHRIDGISPERIEVIHNGVEIEKPDKINPTLLDLGKNNKIVGIVANMNRDVKRVDLFVSAAALVKQQFPDTRFVIVGEGYLSTALKDQAHKLGIFDDVFFAGPAVSVNEWIAGFDIGVICSDSEGLSNSLLEYLALGVPAVATNVGGNPDIIVDGENGFLVPKNSHIALAEKIQQILGNDVLAHKLGENAARTIKDRFSMTAYTAKHEQFYQRCMENK